MMKTRFFVLSLVLAALPFLTGCGGNALQNGDISLSADKDGNLQLTAAGAVTPLLQDVPELSGLRSGGGPVAFSPVSVTRQEVSDSFGEGHSLVMRSSSAEGLVRVVTVASYERFPSTLVVRAV